MKARTNKKPETCPIYGTTTAGERGQIVIPADARAALGIQPGDKMLVMQHPDHRGLLIFKFDAVREFLNELDQNLLRLERQEGPE